MDDDPNPNNIWFSDTINPNFVQRYRVRGTLYLGKTRYQSIQIIDTYDFGRCLVMDGKLQSSEKDEFIYHEALVHPPMIAHSHPVSVFIAGGGEGATLREVLAHRSVQRVVMVDIDEEAVDICRRFLPSLHQGCFGDSRLELLYMDAREYLSQSKEKFDVILMDITDPLEGGPSWSLYTREFYGIVDERLASGGVLGVQSGPCNLHDMAVFTAINSTLRTVFPRVFPYTASVPSFGGVWGFVMATRDVDPLILSPVDIDNRISSRLSQQLRFYDGIAHQGMFNLPRYVRDGIRQRTFIITDQSPIFLS